MRTENLYIGIRSFRVIPFSMKKTFMDIWREYNDNFIVFYETVVEDMERCKNATGVIQERLNQPKNFCPISYIFLG